MKRRATKRGRSRRRWLALSLVGAAVIGAVYVWRAAQPADRGTAGTQGRSTVEPPGSAPVMPGAEDFSAAERQGLDDVLKRRGAGSRR